MDNKKRALDHKNGKVLSGGYTTFDSNSKGSVLSSYGKTVDKFDSVYRDNPEKVEAIEVIKDISARTPFGRADYEFFRPNEALPKNFRDIVKACRLTYQRVGIVRNVIDMMTDFACEDMRIIHPDKKIEAFYKVWAKKVALKEAADEFVRHFLVDGNVVVKRITAKLTKPVEKQWSEKAYATADFTLQKEKDNTEAREIPIKYTFLNVYFLKWVGGDPFKLTGDRKLAFQLSNEFAQIIRNPQTDIERQVVEKLPLDFVEAVKKDKRNCELDMEKLYISYHKKDSWEDWAPPFLSAIIPDIYFKDKLRLAETAALDGIINVIRLWKLGDHKEGILPDDGAISKLLGILQANVGGGAMDIVWDTMIEMEPFYPPVDKILGAEKYQQVNKDILIGLGVPEVLIGGSGGNFSNSWIQLKTLVEKLKFVRSKLEDWISEELKRVAHGMNIDVVPKVRFNQMNLQDENVTKKLILGLLDRGIISVEAVLDAYGEDFLFELERIKRESSIFKKNDITVRTPLPNPDEAQNQSVNQGGRPTKTIDDSARKTRTPNPRTSASENELILFAFDALDAIDKHIIPKYMEDINVKNARKLTAEQKDEISKVRLIALSMIDYKDDLSEETLVNKIDNNGKLNEKLYKFVETEISNFASVNGVAPNLSQRKRIEALAWAKIQGEKNG